MNSTRGFGFEMVKGRMRVPYPPTRTRAFNVGGFLSGTGSGSTGTTIGSSTTGGGVQVVRKRTLPEDKFFPLKTSTQVSRTPA